MFRGEDDSDMGLLQGQLFTSSIAPKLGDREEREEERPPHPPLRGDLSPKYGGEVLLVFS
jgi:hypothetical protein